MKRIGILLLAAALMTCGLLTLAACETPGDTVHTHVFGEWTTVTEPTCTQEGKLERTCACGAKETAPVSALGHGKEMTVRENEVAATCTAKGSYEEVVYCAVCEEELSRRRVETPAAGHTAGAPVRAEEKPATCTEGGSYEEVVYCAVCEEELSRKTVETPGAGHTAGAAATCISAQVCTVCGTVLAPMLAHTPGAPVRAEENPATCTQGGSYEEVISCTVCGGELSRKIVETLALGHDYVNGVCTRCHDVFVTEGLKLQLSADGKSYIVSVYVGYSTEVYIPSVYEGLQVTAIGDRAFEGSERMMRIVLPDTITSIGNSAFSGCLYLEEIRIPDSVTSIGEWAFSGCDNLKSVTLPDSVTSIGYNAFAGCGRLTSIVIPDSVTSIGESAFRGCSGLASVTLPDSVTSIGYNAFAGCGRLTSIVIPDSVTSIGSGAFYRTAYYNDESNWEDDVLYIGNHLIKAEDSISGNYSIRVGAKTIADWAFADCSRLTSIVIPDSVTSIGESAFWGCSSLTSIVIPDSVGYIGHLAFGDCEKLTSVVFADPEGWSVNGEAIDPDALSDPETAAEYLTERYNDGDLAWEKD